MSYSANDLIENCSPTKIDNYNNLINSIKFDLGEINEMGDIGSMIRKPIDFNLPYKTCLFKTYAENDTYFVLAIESEDITSFYGFGYEAKDNFGWYQEDIIITVEKSNKDFRIFNTTSKKYIEEELNNISKPNWWWIDHIICIMKAIEVINCSNVELIDSKEKKFINNKRKKKGKLPLFIYKTLHLIAPSSNAKSKSLGGTHKSPRVHLRRGHIRRLSTGFKTWVQSCVVGNKKSGMIHKDYKVTAQ